MANFDLTNLAVKMICPNNEVKLDDAGLPSVMVYIPKFKNSDVLAGGDSSTHPAFIVNGQEIAGFWYGKYEACQSNGKAYSLPAEDPAQNLDFDECRTRCEAKGAGWHVSTAAEWAAVALWCKKNGTQPLGNNNYGKDTSESGYKAIVTAMDGTNRGRVATGTGPLTWSHDGTQAGIWDLNGNVWEWQGGIRLVWGELQILANNDAADADNPQTAGSALWKAIKASDGTLVDPECSPADTNPSISGNTVRLDYVSSKWTYCKSITSAVDSARNCAFGDVTCTGDISDAAKIRLRALALLPDSGSQASDYNGDVMYWNNKQGERFVFRGGGWHLGASAGVFSLGGHRARSARDWSVGFRAAYVPGI